MADDGCGEIVLEKPAFVLLRFQNMRRPTAKFTLPMTPKHTRDTTGVDDRTGAGNGLLRRINGT